MTKKRRNKSNSEAKKNKRHAAKVTAKDATSLAQRLKKHRGVAADTHPPNIYVNSTGKSFLTPLDDPVAFRECLNISYKGFYHDSPSELPDQLHSQFDSSFEGMDDLFLYDTIQPGKKRLTRTSVTRTLVGDPGSTYKYLGLRLFSHPWVDVDEDGNAVNAKKTGSSLRKIGYPSKTAAALIEMGRANDYLKERSNHFLQKHVSPNVEPVGLVGSADYNLTLVNKMDSTATKRDLKKESAYGMGKVSVGWHRDSGLKDFSSIAVYQTLQGVNKSKTLDGWGVALRAMDGGAGGPLANVPALCVPLPSGSLYYMLDDFNHNHEHAVIAGSGGVRYSSTHRVAREGQGTWKYIRDKSDQFLVSASNFDFSTGTATNNNEGANKKPKDFASIVRSQQMLMNEIEFEWLRQWFVQGTKHASKHHYWHRPMEKLCSSFCMLEEASANTIKLLQSQASSIGHKSISEDLYDVLIECLSDRSKLRKSWAERYNDPVFETIPTDECPMTCSCLDRTENSDLERCLKAGQIPESLDDLIEQIRCWRAAFVQSKQHGEKSEAESKTKKRKKSKAGSLTRKEQKRVASNWEMLKKKI